VVNSVQTNGPAEQVELRPGDRISAVNGVRIQNESSTDAIWTRSKPEDAVALTIERAGEAAPIVLHAVFRARHVEGPTLALS
jgi:C-terminal processing protease CtpA/Prc